MERILANGGVFRAVGAVLGALLALAGLSDSVRAEGAARCLAFFKKIAISPRITTPELALFQVPGSVSIQVQGDVMETITRSPPIGMAVSVHPTGCQFTLTGLSAAPLGGQPVFSATGMLAARSDEPQPDETNYYVTGPMPGSVEVNGVAYYPLGNAQFSVDHLSESGFSLSYSGLFQEFGAVRNPRRIQYRAVVEALPPQ